MPDTDISEMHYTGEGFNNLGGFLTHTHTQIHKHNGLALGCVILHYGFVSEDVCVSVGPFVGAEE